MPNSPFVNFETARGLFKFVPPLIYESLFDDAEFRDELRIISDYDLSLSDSGPTIERSKLYSAIRQALSGVTDVTVADSEGREWRLNIDGEENQFPVPVISHGKQLIKLSHVVLSQDRATRQRFIEVAGYDVNLPYKAQMAWHNVLRDRTPDDDEVDEIYGDLSDTPIRTAHSIRHELANGIVNVSTLVPSSMRYYERLVGSYDGSTSIRDYASSEGRRFFEQLSSWQPYNGFLLSLLLSSHSALTAEIRIELLEKETLVRSFAFLEKLGDRISQLGAIEVGLRALPEAPEIEPFLIRQIKQIRDEDVKGPESRFNLLSTLFHLVDGELSRTRLFSHHPPFYRRLASLTQSALICRQFVNLGVEIDPFCKWVTDQLGVNFIHFYLQSYTDMRQEPRWIPEFAVASQMRGAFLGRIIDAALDCEEALRDSELYDLILGNDSDCLQSNIGFPHVLTVGPLEGGENVSDTTLPFDFEEIEIQFRTEGNGSPPFLSLILFGPLLPYESVLSEVAADALRRNNHRLDDIGEKSQLLIAINGLASVAAVTRSRPLADELRILVRKYRRDTQHALSPGEAMRVCLAAAASRPDLEDWREFVGSCLTELAFGELEDEDIGVLSMQLQYLCHVDPGLWALCSRADAALKSLRGY